MLGGRSRSLRLGDRDFRRRNDEDGLEAERMQMVERALQFHTIFDDKTGEGTLAQGRRSGVLEIVEACEFHVRPARRCFVQNARPVSILQLKRRLKRERCRDTRARLRFSLPVPGWFKP